MLANGNAYLLMHLQALEVPAPLYFRHLLICDASGKKLSKCQRSESITRMREAGVSTEEIIGGTLFQAGLANTATAISLREALNKYII